MRPLFFEKTSARTFSRKKQKAEWLLLVIEKHFTFSVANVIGTGFSKYKLNPKGYFACSPMHVGRDEQLPVAPYAR